MTIVLAVLLVVGVMASLANERVGFVISLVTGFLQDPIRKVLPGEPVYLVALVAVFVAATFVGMRIRGIRLDFRYVHAWNPVLRIPLVVFVSVVFVQATVSLVRTGSPVIPAIGLLAYLSPLATLLVGYWLASRETHVRRLLIVYCTLALLMMSTVILSAVGLESPLFEAVGVGLFAYAPDVGVLKLHSGLFRGSELAGWHGATAAALLTVIVISRRKQGPIWALMVSAIPLLLLAVVFTGRRKFLVSFFIFLVLLAVLLPSFRAGSRRFVGLLLASAAAVMALYAVGTLDVFVGQVTPYLGRGAMLQEQAADRVSGMAWGSLRWVIARNGLFGAGAGMGSQGAQYFGGGADVVGAAAEGGIGKILAELGIQGLFAVGWLFLGVGRYLWAVLSDVSRRDPALSRLAIGLVAFLVANASVFVIAHQIFGDVFVLLLIGWILGTIMAIPVMEPDRQHNKPETLATRPLAVA